MKRMKRFFGLFALLCVMRAVWAGEESSLVLHFTFDEGEGSVVKDASGNGNDGVVKGNLKWVEGKIGKALQFDGKEVYVDIPNLKSLDFNKSFTIAAWVKSTSSANDCRTIVTNLRDLVQRKGFAIFDEYGQNRINVYRSSPDRSNYETTVLNFFEKDQWVHMAVVADFEKDALKVYKNGTDVQASHLTDVKKSNWNHGTLLRVGAENVGTRKPPYFFEGAIDDLRIYQKALTPDEVAAIAKMRIR